MRCHVLGAGLIGLVLLSDSARAQDFQFTIDQPASSWTWSGTTSLGPLEGNPDTNFNLTGTVGMDLDSGGNPVGAGQVVSANALVVPDLHGLVPNPIPILPPLALVDVTNLSLSYSTDPFPVAPGGSFVTNWTVTILTGTLTVTPLAGSVTVTDLAGTVGDPVSNPGSITASGGQLLLVSPQSAVFDFVDSSSGLSATLTLTGTLQADFGCPPPASYCVTSPNTVGAGALISVAGSASVAANDLVLNATNAPPFQNGLFYYGPAQIQLPFGEGVRCVGGGGVGVFRLGVLNSGAAGVFTKIVDYGNLMPGGDISAGDTWNFQCWYRDPQGGPAGFNFSDAVEVFFCP